MKIIKDDLFYFIKDNWGAFISVYNKCKYLTDPKFSKIHNDDKDVFNTIYLSIKKYNYFYKSYLKGLSLTNKKNAGNFIFSYYPNVLINYLSIYENPNLVRNYYSHRGFESLKFIDNDYLLTVATKNNAIEYYEKYYDRRRTRKILRKLIENFSDKINYKKALLDYITKNSTIREIQSKYKLDWKYLESKFVNYVKCQIKKKGIELC